jgi:cation-transporting ATPase F
MLDPEVNPTSLNRATIEREAEVMAQEGLRVLAFAQKAFNRDSFDHQDLQDGLIFLGLQGTLDRSGSRRRSYRLS